MFFLNLKPAKNRFQIWYLSKTGLKHKTCKDSVERFNKGVECVWKIYFRLIRKKSQIFCSLWFDLDDLRDSCWHHVGDMAFLYKRKDFPGFSEKNIHFHCFLLLFIATSRQLTEIFDHFLIKNILKKTINKGT